MHNPAPFLSYFTGGVFTTSNKLETVWIAVLLNSSGISVLVGSDFGCSHHSVGQKWFCCISTLRQRNNSFVIVEFVTRLKCRMLAQDCSLPGLACGGVELRPKQLFQPKSYLYSCVNEWPFVWRKKWNENKSLKRAKDPEM